MSAAVPSWARKGAKVVCIHNGRMQSPSSGSFCEPEVKPAVGGVYTVRRVLLHDGDVCLCLNEVRQIFLTKRFGFTIRREGPYLVGRFAPAVKTSSSSSVSQSDDISAHFQHHLSNPVREEA